MNYTYRTSENEAPTAAFGVGGEIASGVRELSKFDNFRSDLKGQMWGLALTIVQRSNSENEIRKIE